VEGVGRGNVDGVEVRVLNERVDGCVKGLDVELVGKGASGLFRARVDSGQLPLICCLSALDEGLGDPVGADDAECKNHFDCSVLYFVWVEDRYRASQKCQIDDDEKETAAAPQSLMTRVAAGCTFLQRELQANSGVVAFSKRPGVLLPLQARSRRAETSNVQD